MQYKGWSNPICSRSCVLVSSPVSSYKYFFRSPQQVKSSHERKKRLEEEIKRLFYVFQCHQTSHESFDFCLEVCKLSQIT